MEIWKDIQEYEGLYQISNFGNVKSFKCHKKVLLKPQIDSAGYYHVCLSKNKKAKTIKIHQLVAVHFLNHVPCGMKLVINHKDFNKLNNHVDNLELITARENGNLKHIKSTSKYVGVHYYKFTNKYRAQILINGKSKHLGYYKNEYDAHLAYQNELIKLS